MGLVYKEVDGVPVPCPDILEWAQWYERANRTVLRTQLLSDPPVAISTVFLGVDHNHLGVGAPLLYETMVFGGPHDLECERYSTRAEAEEGHRRMCERVFANETGGKDVAPNAG